MGNCSLSDPKRNTAIRQRLLEIVDNQGWLFGAIDVEFGNLPSHLDLDLGSLPGDEVDIGLVLARSLTAELVPRKSWNLVSGQFDKQISLSCDMALLENVLAYGDKGAKTCKHGSLGGLSNMFTDWDVN